MTAMRNRWDACHACRTSFDQIPLAPMLFDGSWRKLSKRDEILCAQCMFVRAVKRGICITLADLKPCPINRSGEPSSWFDFFAKGERPEVIEVWRKWFGEVERTNEAERARYLRAVDNGLFRDPPTATQ